MAQTYVTGWKIVLTRKLNPWDTSLYADRDLWITTWRLYAVNDSTQEWFDFTSVTASGAEFIYWGLTRRLSQTADPATWGTGLTWLAATQLINVAMHDQLIDKNQPITFNWSITATDIRFSWTSTSWLRTKSLTTTQRLALTPANWDIVYDSTLWENYQYIAWAWSAISAGSTQPNASETVAGKVEIATSAQMDAWTDTWETGALLVWIPSKFQRKEFVEKLNVNWLTEKTNISDDDLFIISDASASNIQKKITWINLTELRFWNWTDWDVTVTTTITLTRDMYYNNLTVTSPGIINTAWYRVYVKNTLSWNWTIQNLWNNWWAWNNSTTWTSAWWTAGTKPNNGTLYAWVAGSTGGTWVWWSAWVNAWVAGTSANPSYSTTNWVAGGAGWSWWTGSWAGWAAGTSTRWTYYNYVTPNISDLFFRPTLNISSTPYLVCAWSGWGWSGAWINNGSWKWASWGWSGSTWGMIFISARIINFSGTMNVTWGNGWIGWKETNFNLEAAGWWAGGNGWIIYLVSKTFTSIWTQTVAWWTWGAGGTSSAGWTYNWHAWSNGNSWVTIQITI